MTPAARLAAAADILDTLDLSRPVEAQLRVWARGNRYAGSKDRRAIADRIYTIIRRRRSAALQGGGETGRALVLGSLIAADGLPLDAVEALCSGGYGLATLSEAERETLSREPAWPGDAARLDWPEWLMDAARAVFGEAVEAELDALRQRAPVDLRVNTLKATPEQALAALHAEGLEAVPLDRPNALRLHPAAPVLNSRAWREGMVELQDAGSQAVATLTDAAPGEVVLDYCAGGGGKTLALAAMMQNEGRLLAHDVDPARMADLPQRAARAGATCITALPDPAQVAGECDRVLVDAPCSGSGSWRRDAAGKWRLTAEGLNALTAMQDAALDGAARCVRPGGVLVYATCSVLRVENEARVDAFLLRHPEFTRGQALRLYPGRDGCDGFFAACLDLTMR